jgi:hypothetical protein
MLTTTTGNVYARYMPKEPKNVKLILILPEPMLTAVDDYRFATRQPSRMSAVRALLTVALKAEGVVMGQSPPPASKRKAPRR